MGGVFAVTPARLCYAVPAHIERRTCLNTRSRSSDAAKMGNIVKHIEAIK